jgi:hypothetical protein
MTDSILTDAEKQALVLGLGAGFAVGIWAGAGMVPAEALDVPMTETPGYGGMELEPVYRPYTGAMFLTSLAAVVIALGYTVHVAWRNRAEEPEEADR